jgi:hypothetical protein
VKQKICAFHLDLENDWVADLECGHKQHVRHKPPWIQRSWVLSEEGRRSHIGIELNCKVCDELEAV